MSSISKSSTFTQNSSLREPAMHMTAETRPKKQISERRRQQNKQAQKNYRKPTSQALITD
jgi:hypothetical protein